MIGAELLDDPAADPALVARALRDLERLNTLYGGTRAVVRALDPVFRAARGATLTLLDVGTGAGDIPRAAAARAARWGVRLRLLGVERLHPAARAARRAGLAVVLADGGLLPVAPKSVDIVTASQVLHHFPAPVASCWIAGFDRAARRAVVVADLRRSRLAMAGLWLSSFALGLHPVTRHDGVLSLRRGYTREELAALVRRAGVADARVYGAPLARLVAAWRPAAGR